MTDHCAVCGKENAAEMTDGRELVRLCDNCRPFVVMLWQCGSGTLTHCAAEAKQAKFGDPMRYHNGR